MAGAHCAITSPLVPPTASAAATTTKFRRATALSKNIRSSIPASSPLKRTNRKNHLRLKILKTLTKPSKTLPIIIPFQPYETPQPNDVNSFDGDFENVLEVSETSSTVAIAPTGRFGRFSTSLVLKYGIYLLGIYLFQAFFTVWILDLADSKERENSESERRVRVLESSKKKVVLNGIMGELELEAKISEIRTMATNARKTEAREREKSGLVSEFDVFEDVRYSKNVKVTSGIQKEVDTRLVKLKNSLDLGKEKSLGSPVENLSKSRKVGDGVSNGSLDANRLNGALFIEKKHRFKNQSTKPRIDAKGFQGVGLNKKNGSPAAMVAMQESGSNDSESLNRGKQIESPEEDLQRDVLKTLEEGVVQDTNHGRVAGESKIRNSSGFERNSSFSFGKVNHTGSASSEKLASPSRSSSSKGREHGSKQTGNNVRNLQSETKNDLWWLKIPYLLAIFLRRSSDPEEPGGLYTLEATPDTADQSDSSYTVVFEDRSDANNFCYLLESFFEDLGDFRADIVPLSTKGLQEDVQSDTKKLIAVKKGQLKLYAGQPLDDAEADLRALAEL